MNVGCKHGVDGRLVPCPPMCPTQEWPYEMFRLTFFRSRWKLRRRYRNAEAEWDARTQAWLAADPARIDGSLEGWQVERSPRRSGSAPPGSHSDGGESGG